MKEKIKSKQKLFICLAGILTLVPITGLLVHFFDIYNDTLFVIVNVILKLTGLLIYTRFFTELIIIQKIYLRLSQIALILLTLVHFILNAAPANYLEPAVLGELTFDELVICGINIVYYIFAILLFLSFAKKYILEKKK